MAYKPTESTIAFSIAARKFNPFFLIITKKTPKTGIIGHFSAFSLAICQKNTTFAHTTRNAMQLDYQTTHVLGVIPSSSRTWAPI